MSICRWSSDNWQCDLYCYGDVSGGITTHVAGNRIVGEVPEVPYILDVTPEEYFKAHKKQMDWLDKAKRKKIGLPHDSESFNDPDWESFLERLLHLREVGYNFPDYAIEGARLAMEAEVADKEIEEATLAMELAMEDEAEDK